MCVCEYFQAVQMFLVFSFFIEFFLDFSLCKIFYSQNVSYVFFLIIRILE